MDWNALFNEEIATVLPVGAIVVKLSIALIIVAVGFFMGRLAGKIVRKTIEALELRESLEKAGVHVKPEVIGEHIIKYVIYVGAAIIALNQLGITPVVLNILFAGIIAVILIAIFLSLKDFVPNLISGMYILAIKKIEVGDTVQVNGVKGKVVEISLLETTLNEAGNKVMIPNSTITKSQIVVQKKLK